MALHANYPSMLRESLRETVEVAEYCVNYRKVKADWGTPGCYGYPAAILLFSAADTIGSYVIDKTSNRKSFDIFDHGDYYNLGLGKGFIDKLYSKTRNLLTHNSVLAQDIVLDIGEQETEPFKDHGHAIVVYLVPFLAVTKTEAATFLENADTVVTNSKRLQRILKT